MTLCDINSVIQIQYLDSPCQIGGQDQIAEIEHQGYGNRCLHDQNSLADSTCLKNTYEDGIFDIMSYKRSTISKLPFGYKWPECSTGPEFCDAGLLGDYYNTNTLCELRMSEFIEWSPSWRDEIKEGCYHFIWVDYVCSSGIRPDFTYLVTEQQCDRYQTYNLKFRAFRVECYSPEPLKEITDKVFSKNETGDTVHDRLTDQYINPPSGPYLAIGYGSGAPGTSALGWSWANTAPSYYQLGCCYCPGGPQMNCGMGGSQHIGIPRCLNPTVDCMVDFYYGMSGSPSNWPPVPWEPGIAWWPDARTAPCSPTSPNPCSCEVETYVGDWQCEPVPGGTPWPVPDPTGEGLNTLSCCKCSDPNNPESLLDCSALLSMGVEPEDIWSWCVSAPYQPVCCYTTGNKQIYDGDYQVPSCPAKIPDIFDCTQYVNKAGSFLDSEPILTCSSIPCIGVVGECELPKIMPQQPQIKLFDKQSWAIDLGEPFKTYLDKSADRWMTYIKFDQTIAQNIQSLLPGWQGIKLNEIVFINNPSSGMIAACGPYEYVDLIPGTAGIQFNTISFDLYINLAYYNEYDSCQWVDIITHELGHALGIGVYWSDYFQSQGSKPPIDNFLLGNNYSSTQQAYNEITDLVRIKIPVEDTGGQGTAGGHWEPKFRSELYVGAQNNKFFGLYDELMVGYFSKAVDFKISKLSINALVDFGYLEVEQGSNEGIPLLTTNFTHFANVEIDKHEHQCFILNNPKKIGSIII